MKILFLSRYQNTVERGAEVFVKELVKRISQNNQVEIKVGAESDSLTEMIKGHYDIVIPINGRMQSLKASLGRVLGGYKLVITGHSGIGRDDIWNIVIVKPNAFVALTDVMYKWAKGYAWGSQTVKISNGIDLNKFTAKGEKIELDLPKPIILSVGSLVWYKYHQRAIEAVSRMSEGSLVIVGQGEQKDELLALGEAKLKGRFKIMQIKYADMPKIYRSADLFTLPSWEREAFGLVYLEAVASNLPVVAPDDESRREIVGDGGLFVDVSDPIAYAKVLTTVLKLNWQNKPRKQAENFSWDKIAKQYEDLFIKLIK